MVRHQDSSALMGRLYHARGATEHHMYDDCPEGVKIPKEQRVQGDGGLPRCRTCERFSAEEAARLYGRTSRLMRTD